MQEPTITFKDDFIYGSAKVWDAYVRLSSIGKPTMVTVSGKRRIGKIIKLNKKTVWVRIMKGVKTSFTIKRHITKHNVRFI